MKERGNISSPVRFASAARGNNAATHRRNFAAADERNEKEKNMIPVQHIHPMLVHFPIVLVFVLAAFDLIATARGAAVTGRTVAGNISTAVAVSAAAFAVATWYFGGLALDHAEAGGFSSDIAETHEGLGETVAMVLAAWAVIRTAMWWRDLRPAGAAKALMPAVAMAGAALVTVTAYYGGLLVYELGVNVTRTAAGA
jgi:uncharacterized membrane protein